MFCAAQTPLLPEESSGVSNNRSSDDSVHTDASSKIKCKKKVTIFLIFNQYDWGDLIEKDEVVGKVAHMGKKQMHREFW
jgi:hypothetical protein